jgi:hypothetical protein
MSVCLHINSGSCRAWRVELARLWLSVAELIQPFYAEIRTGECPTKSWWWNGIPSAIPSALLIGQPYAELWPDFVSAARTSSTGLHYLEHFVETASDEGENRIPSPPVCIAQPAEPVRQTVFDPSKPEDLAAMRASIFEVRIGPYPEVWPFDGPVSPPRDP